MIYNRSNRFLGGVGGILASDSLGALQRIVRSLGDIEICDVVPEMFSLCFFQKIKMTLFE